MRVLGRLRLSVATDESTSIERQRELIEQWAAANDHEVVGWAEDQDVSGSVDPFSTPQLGEWLNHRLEQFDIIAAWKLDRISRSAIRLNSLISWCLDHDKSLVSCSEAIDISTPVGRLIANVIGFLAEGELEAMRERQKASRRKLRETARWAGGKPPYGYRVVDTAEGKKLRIDPLAHKVVRRIVDELLEGRTLAQICNSLNDDGVVSPADYYRVVEQGEDADTGSPWRTWAMKQILKSPALVGHAQSGGVTIRDDNGDPILMAQEPLVTLDERELILAEIERTEMGPRQRGNPLPLVGVLFCWYCETGLTTTSFDQKRGEKVSHYSYYRCPNRCGSMIPSETADFEIERLILDAMGDEQITARAWVPGDNNDEALKAAIRGMEDIAGLLGTVSSKTMKDRLQRQLEALDVKIAELESKPGREGHYEYVPTGQTYREAWDKAETADERREVLKKIGVNVRMGVSPEGYLLSHPMVLGDRMP